MSTAKSEKKPTRRPSKKPTRDNEPKKTVEEIIIERLLKVIEEDKTLPWLKPWVSPCMNWYTKREYKGINVILLMLSGGTEFITMNQLKEYNEKNNTKYHIKKGSISHPILFSDTKTREITASQAQDAIAKGHDGYVFQINGLWYRKTFIRKYFRVFDIRDVTSPTGETLAPHVGNGVEMRFNDADEVISKYVSESGVRVKHMAQDRAYYQELTDTVVVPVKNQFKDSKSYYRVIFHELIHSTGVKERLNRACYTSYHMARTERSKEELVAEVGSMFLSTHTGIREENKQDLWDYNSESYITGWVSYIKDNPKEVISAFSMAERAKSYILGNKAVEEGVTEQPIGNA